MRFLILGDGYLGKRFHRAFDDSILSKKRIVDIKSSLDEIETHDPDIVLNCIGKTGKPNIDWCEKNKIETVKSNVNVPIYLAEACETLGKKMIHLSSGCMYMGNKENKGFEEDDPPNFFGSFYIRTKILSEDILRDFNVLQIRFRMPIDWEKNNRNLLNKLLSYKKIVSTPNSITVVDDMIEATKQLVEKKQVGVFNVVNPGSITHPEILDIYQKLGGGKISFQVITPGQLDKLTVAGRSNCILSTEKLKNKGIILPDVQESVEKCLKMYVQKNKTN